MPDRLFFALTLLAALSCGLTAGALFAFSSLLMPGLRKLPAAGAITAMRAIDSAVARSVFVLTFTGAGIVCVVAATWSLLRRQPGTVLVVAGAVLYLFGTIAVTRIVHLPRNAALHEVDPSTDESAAWWGRYVSVWTAWNHVRTVAALLASASMILALVR